MLPWLCHFDLSVPQFPHLEGGGNIFSSLALTGNIIKDPTCITNRNFVVTKPHDLAVIVASARPELRQFGAVGSLCPGGAQQCRVLAELCEGSGLKSKACRRSGLR